MPKNKLEKKNMTQTFLFSRWKLYRYWIDYISNLDQTLETIKCKLFKLFRKCTNCTKFFADAIPFQQLLQETAIKYTNSKLSKAQLSTCHSTFFLFDNHNFMVKLFFNFLLFLEDKFLFFFLTCRWSRLPCTWSIFYTKKKSCLLINYFLRHRDSSEAFNWIHSCRRSTISFHQYALIFYFFFHSWNLAIVVLSHSFSSRCLSCS